MSIQQMNDRFEELLVRRDRLYERYAKGFGLNGNTMYIFYLLRKETSCTQKQLCEALFLPKQTVNSMVQGFVKQGLIRLTEKPEDKRHKTIGLTEKGRAYAETVIDPLLAAEGAAMEQMARESQHMLLLLTEQYVDAFARVLLGSQAERKHRYADQ